jgi:hypothetical protein
MKVMQPTMKLRFVEREIIKPMIKNNEGTGYFSQRVKTKVLQQWWAEVDVFNNPSPHGEWRDVPLEVEQ